MIPLPKNYLETYWPFNFVKLKSLYTTSISSHYPTSQRLFLIFLQASLIASKYKSVTRTLEYDPKSQRKAQGGKRKSKNHTVKRWIWCRCRRDYHDSYVPGPLNEDNAIRSATNLVGTYNKSVWLMKRKMQPVCVIWIFHVFYRSRNGKSTYSTVQKAERGDSSREHCSSEKYWYERPVRFNPEIDTAR